MRFVDRFCTPSWLQPWSRIQHTRYLLPTGLIHLRAISVAIPVELKELGEGTAG
jgi:hypothetical protein